MDHSSLQPSYYHSFTHTYTLSGVALSLHLLPINTAIHKSTKVACDTASQCSDHFAVVAVVVVVLEQEQHSH